jgi:hypothetical protein
MFRCLMRGPAFVSVMHPNKAQCFIGDAVPTDHKSSGFISNQCYLALLACVKMRC